MGRIIGTDIVREGLVFSIDPMNPKSWLGPDSDTINNLKSSSTGSISYDTSGSYGVNKSFTFDGADDYFFFPQFDFTSTHTIEFWINPSSLAEAGLTGYAGTTFAWGYFPAVRFFLRTNGQIQYYLAATTAQSYYTSAGSVSINNWFQITHTANYDTSTANMYINGIKDSSSPQSIAASGNWNYTGASNNYDFIDFGRNVNNNNIFYTGNSSALKIYNRVLNQNEVLQNYKALKGRFIN